jgi:excisionase family DNA binding protein
MENSYSTRSRVRAVAERNSVSQSTIWRLIRSGQLTAHRVGRRITLIDDSEANCVFGGKSAHSNRTPARGGAVPAVGKSSQTRAVEGR